MENLKDSNQDDEWRNSGLENQPANQFYDSEFDVGYVNGDRECWKIVDMNDTINWCIE